MDPRCMPEDLCDGFDKAFRNVILMQLVLQGVLSHLVTATNVGGKKASENLDGGSRTFRRINSFKLIHTGCLPGQIL